jgi:hypothetical protein
MGKSKPWTTKRIAFWTLIVTALAVLVAALQYFKKAEGGVTVHSKSGVTVVGDNANLTVDQRTGIDPNEYRSLAEEKGRADERIAKLKEEMREIEATKYEVLNKRYSLGYILFYVDHKNVVIPNESRLGTECAIDLSKAKVTFNDTAINVDLPDFKCVTGPTISDCGWSVSRTFGQQAPVRGNWVARDTQMYFELLVDHGDSLVCVLGFAKDTK